MRKADSLNFLILSSSAPRRLKTSWLQVALSKIRRLIIPACSRGRLKATIDAFAMTVLSRSKNAASIQGVWPQHALARAMEPP